jgi:hypothetical protein
MQVLNGTLTPAQIGSALVPNRSNASGLGFLHGS